MANSNKTKSNTPVVVYTLPDCRQCDFTKRYLDRDDVPYEVRDMSDPQNLAAAKELGHLAAPVVVFGKDSWSGFQPERLKKVIEEVKA